MTCQECELLLALEDRSAELDLHLGGCVQCRALEAELAANSEALREMATEAMPSVGGRVLAQGRAQNARRNVMRWGWALAAAAALVIAIAVARIPGTVEKRPVMAKSEPGIERPAARLPVQKVVESPRVRRRLERRRQPARLRIEKGLAPHETLKVQMLTSDPDVVIYWLVEPKEGSE